MGIALSLYIRQRVYGKTKPQNTEKSERVLSTERMEEKKYNTYWQLVIHGLKILFACLSMPSEA